MEKNERINLIISFEDGTISNKDLIRLFKHLKKTKLVYSLQGCYGRTLKVLEDKGYIQ